MMKKHLLLTLSAALVLAACADQQASDNADTGAEDATSQEVANQDQDSKTEEEHDHNHDEGDHDHDHAHGEEGHDHDHDVTVSTETVVDREGDNYIVAHGDHYHEVPVSEVSEDEQKEIDQYLKDNPNLKAEREAKQKIQAGYFEDDQVADRTLEDWQGNWQSVFPYLEDGTLDPVMEIKALESDGEKTADDYKNYYTTGYQTDIKEIKIKDNKITFIKEDGSEVTGEYEAAGSKILDYEKGNRGVRALFTKVGGDEEAFESVQFSDHNIAPTEDVHHFHIFFSNDSHDELAKEMDNWPTFYPASWDGDQILEDQLHH